MTGIPDFITAAEHRKAIADAARKRWAAIRAGKAVTVCKKKEAKGRLT
jgi:hypothetical protein